MRAPKAPHPDLRVRWRARVHLVSEISTVSNFQLTGASVPEPLPGGCCFWQEWKYVASEKDVILGSFWGDEGAKSTTPIPVIPKNAVVLSGSPYERDLHAK